MNNLIAKEKIKDKIFEVRNVQVMLDSDLAKLYECKNGTKDINKAVKRNNEKFPEDFYFQLTENEFTNLRFQNGTSSLKKNNQGGRRYLPYVFTEQGVAMLSSILKTPVADKISVSIMRSFVEMRKYINQNNYMFNKIIRIEDKVLDHDNKINVILNEFTNKSEFKEQLFFNGQIYEAYSLLINIVREAKNEIIVIDNYIDKTIFDFLLYKDENVEVKIYTKNIKCKLDAYKFNLQFPNVKIKTINNFHDRFIIIDNKTLYHVGASLKDLGSKCFAINKLNSKFIEIIKKHLY